jgi:lipopolysaccharide export system permease protein
MTKIDRYIFVLFARTILICFCSLSGVFVVFHAFNHLDDLAKQVTAQQSMALLLAEYYGPYLLMLFDWTASIIALIAMLFTIGWLRRSGEMTALLAAGINHGRIVRPIILMTFVVVLLQLVNREYLIPPYRELLTTKPGELASEKASAMLPSYDKSAGILIEGNGIHSDEGIIEQPAFRLYASYPGFGDVIAGKSAIWCEAVGEQPSGYRITDVSKPENIHGLSTGYLALASSTPVAQAADGSLEAKKLTAGRPILLTSHDTSWLNKGECFVTTTLNPEVLRDNPRSTRLTGMPELVRRVRNASVHSSDALRVMLHERLLRPPLDFVLVLLGLPLVVNRGDKRLFSMIAQAMGIVLLFFGLKTLAGGMGSSGYLLSPSMAAWVPLLVLGPIAFVRYRDVQIQ